MSDDDSAVGAELKLYEAIQAICRNRGLDDDVANDTWLRVRGKLNPTGNLKAFARASVENTVKAKRKDATRAAAKGAGAEMPDVASDGLFSADDDRLFDDPDELRSAVESVCLKAFAERWGREWGSDVERAAKPSTSDEVERDARRIVDKIDKIAREVDSFLREHPVGGERASALLRMLRQRDPATWGDRSGAEGHSWPTLDGRTRLALEWSRRIPSCLTGRAMVGSSSIRATPAGWVYEEVSTPTGIKPKDLAVVSILAGIGGKFEPGRTARQVLETEIEAMKRALTRHRPE